MRKSCIVLSILVGTVIAVSVLIIVSARRINFVYTPFTPHTIITALTSEENKTREHAEFAHVLREFREAGEIGAVATIEENRYNMTKSLDVLIPASNSVYLSLFSRDDDRNSATIDKPYLTGIEWQLKQLVNEDTIPHLAYRGDGKRLDLNLPAATLRINDAPYRLPEHPLLSFTEIEAYTIMQIGDTYWIPPLGAETLIYPLRGLPHEIPIYQPKDGNMLDVSLSSFESRLWRDGVGDCSNKLLGDPDISMASSTDATAGAWSVRLESRNHHACTSYRFPFVFDPSSLYLLSFDYKNLTGDDVKYYYKIYGNKADEKPYESSEIISAPNHEWNTFTGLINPQIVTKSVTEPTNIDVYLYAPSDGSKEIVNLYDNVRIIPYALSGIKDTTALQLMYGTGVTAANQITLPREGTTIASVSNNANLLDEKTASFEDGLWNKDVGDCSNYLTGEADMHMEESADATNGGTALMLSSRNHFACASKNFPVTLLNDRKYKLMFDYKNLAGEKASYYYRIKGKGDKAQDNSEDIAASDRDWHTFETVIDPSVSSTESIAVYFYSPSRGEEITNLYDNVRLVEWTPKNLSSYYLHTAQRIEPATARETLFKPLNKWKYRVDLRGITKPVLLAFPDKYGESWKLYPYALYSRNERNTSPTSTYPPRRDDSLANIAFWKTWYMEKVPEHLHYQVNNYGNGWWVDPQALCAAKKGCVVNPDGTYDISLVIEHSRLRLLYALIGLSSAAFICAGLLVAWQRLRARTSA